MAMVLREVPSGKDPISVNFGVHNNLGLSHLCPTNSLKGHHLAVSPQI